MPRSIEREALNVVQELYKLSAHNYSKVLGVLLEFCDGKTPERFLFDAFFSLSAGRGGSVLFFVHVLCCLKAP